MITDILLDTWQCFKCGEKTEIKRGGRPLVCENPICGKKGPFVALNGPFSYFDGPKFVPMRLATKIMNDNRFVTVTDTEDVFCYNGGAYRPHGESIIQVDAQRELDMVCRTAHVNETVDYVKRATFIPRERFKQPPEEICLKNGILNLRNMEFSPHTPDKFFHNTVPVNYVSDADCPETKKFFREVLNESDIPIIEELIGYCLIRNYFIQKAVLLVGDGSNGKSTLISLIKSFLGNENVSGRSLQELELNRFAKADLYGKLANLYADLTDTALVQTGIFKMMTGGDPISAEHKFKGSFIFTNHAKLIFSANRVPEAKDESDAFFRRWIIINFPNKFEEENADRHILERLTMSEELSGLLNLALEGLKRLIEQGGFSYSRTTDQIREEYIRKSSPVKAFTMDRLEIDPAMWIMKKELYAEFCAYCRERGYPIVAENTFHQKLQQIIRVEDYRPTVDGKRAPAWRGVRYVRAVNDVKAFLLSNIHTKDIFTESSTKNSEIIELREGKNVDILDSPDGTVTDHTEKSTDPSANKGKKTLTTLTQLEKPTFSDLKRRLWRAFAVNPFKPSQLPQHFTDEELVRLVTVMADMEQRGELMAVPLEGGGRVWQLVR